MRTLITILVSCISVPICIATTVPKLVRVNTSRDGTNVIQSINGRTVAHDELTHLLVKLATYDTNQPIVVTAESSATIPDLLSAADTVKDAGFGNIQTFFREGSDTRSQLRQIWIEGIPTRKLDYEMRP